MRSRRCDLGESSGSVVWSTCGVRKRTQTQRFDPSPAPKSHRKQRIRRNNSITCSSGRGRNGGAATSTNTCNTSAERNTEVIMPRATSSTQAMLLRYQGNDIIRPPATSRENESSSHIHGGQAIDLNSFPAISDSVEEPPMNALDQGGHATRTVCVGGLVVSENLSSTAQSIYEKHRDIMKGFSFESKCLKKYFSEKICTVAKDLWTEGSDIGEHMLTNAVSLIGDARKAGIDIDWLDMEVRNAADTQFLKLTSSWRESSIKIEEKKCEIDLKKHKVDEISASIEEDKVVLDLEMQIKEELEKDLMFLKSKFQHLQRTD